jgi:hypothetical protein
MRPLASPRSSAAPPSPCAPPKDTPAPDLDGFKIVLFPHPEGRRLVVSSHNVFTEVKSAGFNTKALKEAIRIRRQDHAEAEETQTLSDLYLAALNE